LQRWITLTAAVIALLAAGNATANNGYKQHKPGDYPPHHQLWLCIHQHEAGSWSATNGRYRGGLQMHMAWGYGSSYDAARDTQETQEWAAELAYKASGYSHGWLGGQWLRWDNGWRCLNYA
jgi:hypothetical protein